jgi:N-acetylneuraminic acid mutarotase
MKTIRRTILYCFLLAVFVSPIIYSCGGDDTSTTLIGNWVKLSDFEGVSRSDAVSFTIGSFGYVGTGYDGEDRLDDFWAYDPARNTWMQKANFPGGTRNAAVGIGMDTVGYIGTGYNGINKLKDFWKYSPASNTWTQKADFAGAARYGSLGFSINDKCYLGTGYDGNYLKDLWEYNPATDEWTQKVSLGGTKRKDAAAFVINGKAYVCSGIYNGNYVTDFWEYTPETDSWAEKAEIANSTDKTFDDKYNTIVGNSWVSFAINGKGYLAVGGKSVVSGIVWEYNPVTDLWIQKTTFEGSERIDAVGFAIGSRGYVTTGRNSSYYFDDLWGFDPEADYDKYD